MIIERKLPQPASATCTTCTAKNRTNRTISQIFWSDPVRDGRYDFTFSSVRTSGKKAILDPLGGANRYYRSVIGDLGMSATAFRAAVAP